LPAALASAEHEPAATTPNPVTTSSDIVYGMPGSGLPPMRAEDLHGQ
jgi:hypothetical protein